MDRHATAVWKGTLKEGNGTLDTQSGALEGPALFLQGAGSRTKAASPAPIRKN